MVTLDNAMSAEEKLEKAIDQLREGKIAFGVGLQTLNEIKNGMKSDHKKRLDETRQGGNDEAWDFARHLVSIDSGDMLERIYWSPNGGKGIMVAMEMSYADAKKTYEAYFKCKEEENAKIHVGDEVEIPYRKGTYIVSEVADNSVTVRTKALEHYGTFSKDFVKKTGKYYAEYVSLIERLKGEVK